MSMREPWFPAREWWLCGECLRVAPSNEWGIVDGNNDTAVCPKCGFEHYDDENSWVDAGSEVEMQRKARDERAASSHAGLEA